MNAEKQDFNELLDDIVLAEEKLNREGYEEGLEVGRSQGEQEGYQLGYAQGVQLGVELAEIYATVVAQQTQNHTEKVRRSLQQLRKSIDDFPRDNNPEADIIGTVESIRNQYKRVRVLTTGKVGKFGNKVEDVDTTRQGKNKDLSF
ncbi:protein LTO1 homolog [Rhagoletis pomonella]|uniref:protein LTO1 homolog n=1 Tax=Rhagoletis pomonella TaxID=28610 RepID=UPI0017833B60|nr:protein LTO1 homolog [Rhagoletis pomonella]